MSRILNFAFSYNCGDFLTYANLILHFDFMLEISELHARILTVSQHVKKGIFGRSTYYHKVFREIKIPGK